MDKNAEVLVCGASIMKDVWEIRLREYRQKRQMEEERIRKSALERINQDWQGRMSYKIKTPKRLERKAKLPEESTLDAHKAKKTYLGRPQGFQSSRIQKQAEVTKTTKVNKLALLRHLNESCPGLMVWAKSWKFSQPLPKPEESPCADDWGHSWKFLNLQPNMDSKPWCELGFDANNNMSSNDTFLWEKLSKLEVPEHIQQDLVTSEWERSWKFTQKGKESNESTGKVDRLYNLWGESAPEWQESWKSMKHVKGGDIVPNLTQPSTNEENHSEFLWNNSWMYFKKQLHMKSESSHLAWRESWRVAKTLPEQETRSIQSPADVPEKVCTMIMNVSREMKCTIQYGGRDAQPSEWEKSWKSIKSLSEYKEEISKAECAEVKVEIMQVTEQVKFNTLALPKSKQRQEILHFSKQRDWEDSWRMLKRRCVEERSFRNQRRPQLPSPLQTHNEWGNSWRFTNLTLNQDAGLWQQGWSTSTPPRPIRRVQENEEFPHNGPAGVRAWSDSWRSVRRQHLSERQGAGASTQPVRRHAHARSVADWDQSWTSVAHHGRPSMTEWADSWRFSYSEDLQPEHAWFEKSMELKERKELNSALLDSQTFKDRFPLKDWKDSWRVKKKADSPALAHLVKKEVLDWDNSWMISSPAFYQKQGDCYLNFHLETDVRSHVMSKPVRIESSSEWGRSWKMSNPQPPKNVASWVNAKPKSFSTQDLTLWSKHKHLNYLHSALAKDLKLKFWGSSWRFMKMEGDFNHCGGSVGITAKQMCLNIDQQKPQDKKWSDACKIAKTQPKRTVRSKLGHKEDEDEMGMLAEWMESWKFLNNLKSHATLSVSLGNWKNSWKFLLDVPVNGPKTSKSR